MTLSIDFAISVFMRIGRQWKGLLAVLVLSVSTGEAADVSGRSSSLERDFCMRSLWRFGYRVVRHQTRILNRLSGDRLEAFELVKRINPSGKRAKAVAQIEFLTIGAGIPYWQGIRHSYQPMGRAPVSVTNGEAMDHLEELFTGLGLRDNFFDVRFGLLENSVAGRGSPRGAQGKIVIRVHGSESSNTLQIFEIFSNFQGFDVILQTFSDRLLQAVRASAVEPSLRFSGVRVTESLRVKLKNWGKLLAMPNGVLGVTVYFVDGISETAYLTPAELAYLSRSRQVSRIVEL